jgi:peptide/nickel transport system permease protein
MLSFIGHRLLHAIPVLTGVSFIVFISIYLLPGDVTQQILGLFASEERAAILRAKLGLDRNLLVQYALWVWNLLHGDLGQSQIMRAPVAAILMGKVVNSFILTGASFLLVVAVSFLTATAAAARHRGAFDRVVLVGTFLLASMPVFWLGIVLSYLFGVRWHVLPVSGMHDMANPGGFGDLLRHLVLPAVTTAATSIAIVTRVTRASMIGILSQPYILSARARGIRQRRIVYLHATRDALPAFANICGLQIGYLFGGAVFTEIIFGWPGIGLQLYDSILARDTPMVQGAVLAIAIVFLCSNLLADAIVYALDPRRA